MPSKKLSLFGPGSAGGGVPSLLNALCVMAHAHDLSSWMVWAGGLLQVQGQLGLCNRFRPAWATEYEDYLRKGDEGWNWDVAKLVACLLSMNRSWV